LIRRRTETDEPADWKRASIGGDSFAGALEAYLPTAADYAKVRAWLVAQGFRITLDADSRHAIFARGSNARIRQPLACNWHESPLLMVNSHRQ